MAQHLPSSLSPRSLPSPAGASNEHFGDASLLSGSRLQVPVETVPRRIAWRHVFVIGGVHLLACLAMLPWFFSWTGVALAIAGHFIFGSLGITVCYHRLLTHRGFTCPKWLEHTLALLGVCCLQESPARWVAIHRLHHQHSDARPDPHSPLVNFLWSHVGWLLVEHREHSKLFGYENLSRDLLRDPFYRRLEKHALWIWICTAHVAVYFLVGLIAGWLMTGGVVPSLQFAASVTVWGVFVRTVLVWHVTWSVNSVTHLLGYRNYQTNDGSRNHWLVALLAHGEGWHNNHHADPRSAQHGHKWWEFDWTYQIIRILERLGLARDVVRPGVASERRELTP